MSFGQLELAHLHSTLIQYGPLLQLLSCGKAYLLSKTEQGLKLQLVSLFHTHTLDILPSHCGVFGGTRCLLSSLVHLRLMQPTFMLWYQRELFSSVQSSSVQFIEHISPSRILTYLQKYPVFFLVINCQCWIGCLQRSHSPQKSINTEAASADIPTSQETIGRAFMCSQLTVPKFLKVLDKLFSVMRYPMPLQELNLVFMVFVGPQFKSMITFFAATLTCNCVFYSTRISAKALKLILPTKHSC